MRWFLGAVVVLAVAPRAWAGDFDVLRGPEPTYHWGGFYGGVQGGYATGVANMGPAAGPDISFILRQTAIEQDQQISQWPVLNGDSHPQSSTYGAFLGYNFEWENIILGAEAGYDHVSLSATSDGGLTRNFTDSGNLPAGHHLYYTLTATGSANVSMSNIATFRARAGWEAGNYLPYLFGGLAVGRATVSSSATVAYSAVDFPDSETPPLTPLYTTADPLLFGPVSQSTAATNVFAYGADLGIGVDVALLSHVFVRGELEYIYFFPVDGVHLSVSSAKVGVGYKF